MVPRVLVGSMCDLEDVRQVSEGEAKALANEWRIPHLECSAKLNYNITEVFTTLLREIERVENTGLLDAPENGACNLQ